LPFFLPQLRFVSVQIKDISANRFKEFECNDQNDQWQCGQLRRAKRIFSSSNQLFLEVLHSPRWESLLQGKSDISESLRTVVLPKARDLQTQLERTFQRRLTVGKLRHLTVRGARKLHRTSPDSCAKRNDLIQWLIVDLACPEPALREIASEEKSAIECVHESVNNPSRSRRVSKGLRESVHEIVY
jgi:hypothetical protein